MQTVLIAKEASRTSHIERVRQVSHVETEQEREVCRDLTVSEEVLNKEYLILIVPIIWTLVKRRWGINITVQCAGAQNE